MLRLKMIILALLFCLQLYGQKVKDINIVVNEAGVRTLKLSEITKNIRPVVLEKLPDSSVHDFFLTDEFLFIVGMQSVNMYTSSGKFIRTIECGKFISSNITCDTVSKNIYIPAGKSISHYDYTGQLIKTFNLLNRCENCRFYKGKLYLLSHAAPIIKDSEVIEEYVISELNLQTGKETVIPTKIIEKEVLKDAFAIGKGIFSTTGQGLFAAFTADSVVYQIRDGKAYPCVNMHVQTGFIHRPTHNRFFIGKYLFLNFVSKSSSYLYVDDSTAGQEENKTGLYKSVIDDIYSSGNAGIHPLNRDNYFIFHKKVREIKNIGLINNHLPQENSVVFIAETKE